jgi:DNA-binding response OmpR family regulator
MGPGHGNGATLATCAVAVPAAAGESSLRAAPGRGPRRGRILVVDDPLVRETIRRQLLVLGYEVSVAAGRGEAVAACGQARGEGKRFDAVVLGVRGDDDGAEQTLADVRNLDPGVGVMIWSDWVNPRLCAWALRGGCCVLRKPHALAELQVKLEELLSR